MIEGQGEDSCGKSGTGEPPHERKRRGVRQTWRHSELVCHQTFTVEQRGRLLERCRLGFQLQRTPQSTMGAVEALAGLDSQHAGS